MSESPRRRPRPSPRASPEPRKRAASMTSATDGSEKSRAPTAAAPGTKIHVRWLVESVFCSRILGKSGSQLQNLRARSGGRELDAWISPNVSHQKYRVFNCVGTPHNIAKFAGLMVRVCFDENLDTASDEFSKTYDLQMLVPDPAMGRVLGPRLRHLRDISEKSNAKMSAEQEKLPDSDDRMVQASGVADAIHIAVYYLCELLVDCQSILVSRPNLRQFQGGAKPSARKHNEHSRTSSSMTPPPSSIGSCESSRNEIEITANSPLPVPKLGPGAPQPLRTAYETAKESKRSSIRQVVRFAYRERLTKLLDQIKAVTTCSTTIIDGNDHMGDTLLELEGPPEDNTLALYLIYRHIR